LIENYERQAKVYGISAMKDAFKEATQNYMNIVSQAKFVILFFQKKSNSIMQ